MFTNPLLHVEGAAKYSPWRILQYVIWACLGFTLSWFRSRHYAQMLLGLPAIACVVLLIAADASSSGPLSLEVRREYLTQAAAVLDRIPDAESDDDRLQLLTEAEFYLRRLEDSGVSNEEFLWQRSRLDAIRGRAQRRWDDLHRILQDPDQLRDVDAHLQLARGLALGEWTSEGDDNDAIDVAESMERHLLRAIQISTNVNQTMVAQRALADLYIALQQFDEASELIEELANHIPAERLRLARIHRTRGDEVRAESQANSAKDYFLARVEQGSEVAADWQNLTEAYFLLEEYEDAVALLLRSITVFEDQLPFRRLLARAYVGWSRQIPADEFARRLELLERAAEAYPSDEFVLLALLALSIESNGPEGEAAQARLREALATGDAPVVVHTIIGTNAAINGDAELARFHLDQALQQGQVTPMVLNNLAHILAFGPQHDYEAALALIDQALTIRSDPRMHDTRGQILVRLQRWPEAISSLETALRDMTDYAPLHQSLAEAYAAVGQVELAELHRRKLEELGGPVDLDIDASNDAPISPDALAVPPETSESFSPMEETSSPSTP